MSTNLKNKLLNHTATPPQGVWESIVFQLEMEDNLAQTTTTPFANKLVSFEEVPPTFVWDKIAASLDKDLVEEKNTVAHKLVKYSVEPPTFVWDKITASLDSDVVEEKNTVATKLLQFSVEPPAAVWSKIDEAINNEGAKIISITKRPSYFKLAAAAAVVAIIGSSIWYGVSNNTITNNPAGTLASNTTNNTPSVTPNNADKPALLTPETQEKNNATSNNTAVAKNEKIVPANTAAIDFTPTQEVTPLTKNPFDNKTDKIQDQSGDVAVDIDLVATPNTYMTIIGPDGQSVRVSSKFSKQLGLFTERDPAAMENIDVIIKESRLWRTKIAKWREKLNGSSISPSISNFMDVIELSKILSDKKN